MPNITRECISVELMNEFARNICQAIIDVTKLKCGLIIYLNGPLGAGKTTFTRGFLRAFGYQDKVKSPTYTLVEPYEVNGEQIFHFDLYRLKDAAELHYMGIFEYFETNAISLIEWPEKGIPLLPPPDLILRIEFAKFEGDNRILHLEACSELGKKIFETLS